MAITWSVFTGIFIITYFWNWKCHSASTHATRTENRVFLGFISVIKMTVIQKGCNLVIFYQIFYYNLILELEMPFWIHPHDQNKKMGIFGLPFGNKNDNYTKGL